MNGLLAFTIAIALVIGTVARAEAAGGVPGEGRALYQYGE